MKRAVICLLLLGCGIGGCGASGYEFQPAAGLPVADGQRYKDAAAVILQRDVGVYIQNDPARVAYTEYRQHSIIHILSEAGFGQAEVRLTLGDQTELMYLHARTIAPDGSTQVVTPTEVMDDDVKVGTTTTKRNLKQKVFRFPGIAVGSRIEYAFAIGYQFVWSWDLERVCDKLPIETYNLELALHKNVVSTAAFFNREQAFKREQDGNVTHFFATLKNVPAIAEGWFARPWEDREPWWAFRVNGFNYGNRSRSINDTWEHTLASVARSLYLETGDWTSGYSAPPKVVGCGEDKRCVLEKTVASLRKEVELKNFVSALNKARQLKVALESKEANNLELAMLAHHRLKENGIESKYALVGRGDGLVFERDFPLPNQFDHLLIWIPLQTGIMTPLFLDPSCEHCALGQASSWTQGKEAIIIDGKHSVNDGVSVTLDWRRVTGAAPPIRGYRREHRLKVVGADIEGSAVIQAEGANAVDSMITRAKNQTDKQKREEWDEWMGHRAKTGVVTTFANGDCDRQKARCVSTVSYRVPQFLVADGDGFVLPMELAYSGYDDPKRKLAEGALHAWNSEIVEDVLDVELPKGLAASVLPKPVKIKGALLEVECDATATATGFRFRRVLKVNDVDVPVSANDEVKVSLDAYSQCRKALVTVAKRGK